MYILLYHCIQLESFDTKIITQQPILTHPGLVYQLAHPVVAHKLPSKEVNMTSYDELYNLAQGSEMNARQEAKPDDDDPDRFYWVREKDNSFTQRSRSTIESGVIGPFVWYVEDGIFYAVRV
ncbi:hypothetical protein BGHDH14_bgh01498 [Blumeria hordei DH14]|uniref:Uncharacterized protein n=1 Tax=Blumeria graminis f. sp. hordei (strain DH14) TaxID=546991 RepID=N1JM63_BLUG1|nr:hypothetical protein BGHDH14_bgh01498 [Blumeria hordei DH14]